MPSNKKFPVSKGFYGFKSDDAAFLKPDNTDPFEKGDPAGSAIRLVTTTQVACRAANTRSLLDVPG